MFIMLQLSESVHKLTVIQLNSDGWVHCNSSSSAALMSEHDGHMYGRKDQIQCFTVLYFLDLDVYYMFFYCIMQL